MSKMVLLKTLPIELCCGQKQKIYYFSDRISEEEMNYYEEHKTDKDYSISDFILGHDCPYVRCCSVCGDIVYYSDNITFEEATEYAKGIIETEREKSNM